MAKQGIDPTRLYSALLNTGLQNKDPALYQVIHDLIGQLLKLTKDTNALIASGTSSTSIINQTLLQLIDSASGSDIDNNPMMPPGGSTVSSGVTIAQVSTRVVVGI